MKGAVADRNKEIMEQVHELRKQKFTYIQIGNILNMSHDWIRKTYNRYYGGKK
jgi:hypothetical protein